MLRFLRRAPLLWPALACVCATSSARAGTFDQAGFYSPDPEAVATDDFEEYPPPEGQGGEAGAGQGGEGQGGEAGSGQGGSGAGGEASAGSGGEAQAGSGGSSAGSGGEGQAGAGAGAAGEAGAVGQGGAAGEGQGGEAGAGGEGQGGEGQAGEGQAGEGQGGSGGDPKQEFGYELVDDPTALTGKRVFKLGAWASAGVGFEVPPVDGSYIARVWVKGDAVSTVQVDYSDGTPPVISQLYPTGRVTSDGWIELESGPFSIEPARGPKPGLGFFAPGGLIADAFEVVKGGDFRPARTCEGLGDDACLSDEICMHRRCVDARGFVPPLPPTEGERKALADYMGNRLHYLFGPIFNREQYMGEAMAEIDVMRSASDRYTFWFSFVKAIQKLQDSHSSSFGLFQFSLEPGSFPSRIPLNVCFIGGDADLSHAQVPRDPVLPDVLVSHTGTGATWGLKAGDRVVAIDGQHPVAWARGLTGKSWSSEQVNDPTSHAQHIESLRGTISTLARTITVQRCQGSVCGAPEMLKVADQPFEAPTATVGCDNRPLAHLADVPADHRINSQAFYGLVLDSQPDERIHGMVWDSLYGAGSALSAQISSAASSWRDEGARGVILDHRSGNGGTKDTAMPILDFVSTPKYSEAQVWRSFFDEKGPASLDDGLKLFDQVKDDPFGLTFVGSDDAAVDVPVALLLTRDVSASDYFPNAFKGSPKARIFAPHATNGAFSTFLGYSYWLGLSFQFASQDTINHDGRMLCGHGVPPDEVVEPRQSDLLEGVDTVYEAALAWVRANLKPAQQEAP